MLSARTALHFRRAVLPGLDHAQCARRRSVKLVNPTSFPGSTATQQYWITTTVPRSDNATILSSTGTSESQKKKSGVSRKLFRPYVPKSKTRKSASGPVSKEAKKSKHLGKDDAGEEVEDTPKQRMHKSEYRNVRKRLLEAFRIADPAVTWELHTKAKHDLWTYEQMIAVFAKRGLVKRAFRMYQIMKKRSIKPGSGVFHWLLQACANGDTSGGPNYIERCYYVLDEMDKFKIRPNLHSYNLTLQTCANMREPVRAAEVFQMMQEEKVAPDVSTFSSLILAHSDDLVAVLKLWKDLSDRGITADLRAYNTLLSILKDSEKPIYAVKFYEEELKPKVSRDLRPDKHTFAIVLQACIKAGDTAKAGDILKDVLSPTGQKPHLVFDTGLCNALIKAASRIDVETLDSVLALMKAESIAWDSHTYELIIMAFGNLKQTHKAKAAFDDALRVLPRKAIGLKLFTGMLLAYRSSRAATAAWSLFEQLKNEYKLQPDEVFCRILGDILRKSNKRDLLRQLFLFQNGRDITDELPETFPIDKEEEETTASADNQEGGEAGEILQVKSERARPERHEGRGDSNRAEPRRFRNGDGNSRTFRQHSSSSQPKPWDREASRSSSERQGKPERRFERGDRQVYRRDARSFQPAKRTHSNQEKTERTRDSTA